MRVKSPYSPLNISYENNIQSLEHVLDRAAFDTYSATEVAQSSYIVMYIELIKSVWI